MLKSYQLHVDTASLQTIANSQPFVTKTNSNPFQCQVLLGNRHRTFKSVALKNAQIPLGYYNVRAPYNTITVTPSGGVATVYTLTPGNYSTTTAFASALNSAVNPTGGLMSALGTWSFITNTSQVQYTGTNITIVIPPNLSYPTVPSLLGFTSTQTLTGTTLVGVNSYILNFDTYINIWIENLGTSSLEPAQITYKIPVSVQNGSILQWAENTQHEQILMVTDNAARVDRLNVMVVDRFGQPLNNNGLDWSFTLEVLADT
jgi:hypothetical protein